MKNYLKILYLDNGSIIRCLNGEPIGGGTISNFIFIDCLNRDNNFDVSILTTDTYQNKNKYIKAHVFSLNKNKKLKGFLGKLYRKKNFKIFLLKYLKNNDVDIVINTTDLIYPSVEIAHKYKCKTCSIIRAYENLYSYEHESSFFKKINRIIEKLLFFKQDLKSLRKSDLVTTNSKFMKDFFYYKYDVNSRVIYPSIAIDNKKKKIKKITNIGIINPSRKKGYVIVKKIAKNMPKKNFLFYGKKPKNGDILEKKYKNIYFKGWGKNISNIYKKIDLILVPSLWEEPFGRIPIEAISNGVLPLISNMGGLPETINYDKRLIVNNIRNINDWIERISYFDNNLELLEKIIKEQQNYIKKFSLNIQGEKLKKILKSLSGKDI